MGLSDMLGDLFANSKKKKVSDFLPFEELFPNGDIMTRDWGLMRCFLVSYPDTSTSDAEAASVSSIIQQLYHSFSLFRSEGKAAYWFVMERVPRQLDIDPAVSGAVRQGHADAYDRQRDCGEVEGHGRGGV